MTSSFGLKKGIPANRFDLVGTVPIWRPKPDVSPDDPQRPIFPGLHVPALILPSVWPPVTSRFFSMNDSSGHFEFKEISSIEVLTALRKLPSGKSVGLDLVSNELYVFTYMDPHPSVDEFLTSFSHQSVV